MFYGIISKWANSWKKYLSHRRTSKAQASLHIHAVLPVPSLFTHTILGTGGSFSQRAGNLAPMGGCVCTFEGPLTAQSYRKTPKFSDTQEIAVIILKFE